MLIKVKVSPDSEKEKVVKKSDDSFEISVEEKPIMGLANRAVVSALAFYLKVPKSKIRLVKGFQSTNKIFEVVP